MRRLGIVVLLLIAVGGRLVAGQVAVVQLSPESNRHPDLRPAVEQWRQAILSRDIEALVEFHLPGHQSIARRALTSDSEFRSFILGDEPQSKRRRMLDSTDVILFEYQLRLSVLTYACFVDAANKARPWPFDDLSVIEMAEAESIACQLFSFSREDGKWYATLPGLLH